MAVVNTWVARKHCIGNVVKKGHIKEGGNTCCCNLL